MRWPTRQEPDALPRREVKLSRVVDSGRCDQQVVSVSYSAAIESAATGDTDPDLVRFRPTGCGFPEAQRRVILASGPQKFPVALEIVDPTPRAASGTPPRPSMAPAPTSGQWACGELEAGSSIPFSRPSGRMEEALRCSGYLEKNRHRMRYPEFRQRGCQPPAAASNPVARIVGDRLKRGGMHWTAANAIIALKCCRRTSGPSGRRPPDQDVHPLRLGNTDRPAFCLPDRACFL